MTQNKIRLFVPHPLFGEALIKMLSNHYVVINDSEIPDVLLVDESMVREDILREVITENNGAKLVVIGHHNVPPIEAVTKFAKLGARGYIRGSATIDAVIYIIEAVLAGNTVWPAEVLEGLRENPFIVGPVSELPQRTFGFSSRELELLKHLRAGASNKHIARSIGIAEATVKTHVKAILRKLRVQNRTQAALWVHNNGVMSDGLGYVPARTQGLLDQLPGQQSGP